METVQEIKQLSSFVTSEWSECGVIRDSKEHFPYVLPVSTFKNGFLN